MGFHPVAVVNNLIKNRKERAVYKGETMHQTIQEHRIHKYKTKQENKHKKNNKLYDKCTVTCRLNRNIGTTMQVHLCRFKPIKQCIRHHEQTFFLFEKLKMLDVGLVFATGQFFVKVVLTNNLHILSLIFMVPYILVIKVLLKF